MTLSNKKVVSAVQIYELIYSCFDKGCPTKAFKRTRQCRLVLWVESVWRGLIEVHGVYQQEKRRHK